MWTFMLHIYCGQTQKKTPCDVEIVYYDKYLLNDSSRNLFIQLWLRKHNYYFFCVIMNAN